MENFPSFRCSRRVKNRQLFEWICSDRFHSSHQTIRLKKFKIRCVSIGFDFFNDVIEFCPNVKVSSFCVHSPRHRLENHCLTALLECKKLLILVIEMPTIIIVFENEEQIHHEIDDIGIFRLLGKCRYVQQIPFRFEPSHSMITSLAKWMESEDNTLKKTITLEFVPSLDMIYDIYIWQIFHY